MMETPYLNGEDIISSSSSISTSHRLNSIEPHSRISLAKNIGGAVIRNIRPRIESNVKNDRNGFDNPNIERRVALASSSSSQHILHIIDKHHQIKSNQRYHPDNTHDSPSYLSDGVSYESLSTSWFDLAFPITILTITIFGIILIGIILLFWLKNNLNSQESSRDKFNKTKQKLYSRTKTITNVLNSSGNKSKNCNNKKKKTNIMSHENNNVIDDEIKVENIELKIKNSPPSSPASTISESGTTLESSDIVVATTTNVDTVDNALPFVDSALTLPSSSTSKTMVSTTNCTIQSETLSPNIKQHYISKYKIASLDDENIKMNNNKDNKNVRRNHVKTSMNDLTAGTTISPLTSPSPTTMKSNVRKFSFSHHHLLQQQQQLSIIRNKYGYVSGESNDNLVESGANKNDWLLSSISVLKGDVCCVQPPQQQSHTNYNFKRSNSEDCGGANTTIRTPPLSLSPRVLTTHAQHQEHREYENLNELFSPLSDDKENAIPSLVNNNNNHHHNRNYNNINNNKSFEMGDFSLVNAINAASAARLNQSPKISNILHEQNSPNLYDSSSSPTLIPITPSSISSSSTSATTNTTPNAAIGYTKTSSGRFTFSPKLINDYNCHQQVTSSPLLSSAGYKYGNYFKFPEVDIFTPPTNPSIPVLRRQSSIRVDDNDFLANANENMVSQSSNKYYQSPLQCQNSNTTPTFSFNVNNNHFSVDISDDEVNELTMFGDDNETKPNLLRIESVDNRTEYVDAPSCSTSSTNRATRRARLKSISLDSEGARLVEENLCIPVEELVEIAANQPHHHQQLPQQQQKPSQKSIFNFSAEDILSNANQNNRAAAMYDAKKKKNILDLTLNLKSKDKTLPADEGFKFNEFYFEYYDYEDEEDEDFDSASNNDLYSEIIQQSQLQTPKTPTLTQTRQKASSLDSDQSLHYLRPQSSDMINENHNDKNEDLNDENTDDNMPKTTLKISSVSVPTTPKRHKHHRIHHQQYLKHKHIKYGYASSSTNSIGGSNNSLAKTANQTAERYPLSSYQQKLGSFDENLDDYQSLQARKAKKAHQADMKLSSSSISLQRSNNLSVSNTNLRTLPEIMPVCDFADESMEKPFANAIKHRASILLRRGSNHSLSIHLDSAASASAAGASVASTSAAVASTSSTSVPGSSGTSASGTGAASGSEAGTSHASTSRASTSRASTSGIGAPVASTSRASTSAAYQPTLSRGLSSSNYSLGNYKGSQISLAGSSHNLPQQQNPQPLLTLQQQRAQMKRNLLQRRGSNTSLSLTVQGSSSSLNRFNSHSSLNIQNQPNQRASAARRGLLERRSSNASLTLNIQNRALSVSNCNLRGSICSLNSMMTHQTQNDALMLEEDEHHLSVNNNKKKCQNQQNCKIFLQQPSSSQEILPSCSQHNRRKFLSSDSLHNITNSVSNCCHHDSSENNGNHHRCQRNQKNPFGSVDDIKHQNISTDDDCCCSSTINNNGSNKSRISGANNMFTAKTTVTSTSSTNNLSSYSNCSCCCCNCDDVLINGVSGMSISNTNIRNITTKPLSPQTTSEDFKIYLANIQFLQNASNMLNTDHLNNLHYIFKKSYNSQNKSEDGVLMQSNNDVQLTSLSIPFVVALPHERTADASKDTKHQNIPSVDDQKNMLIKIHQEFWDLPTNYQEKPLVFGSQAKNRYKTILPNEHSRVILNTEEGSLIEPYINANFIKGPDYTNNSYIATQGPMANTIYEFWLMIFQNIMKVSLIRNVKNLHDIDQKLIMLTDFIENSRQKCSIYFPQNFNESIAFTNTSNNSEDNQRVMDHADEIFEKCLNGQSSQATNLNFNYFVVKNNGVCNKNGYTMRKLFVVYSCLTKSGDSQIEKKYAFTIHHYWFPDWPDHRSPEDIDVLLDMSLDILDNDCTLDFVKLSSTTSALVKKKERVASLPIIHCSAGIGRTGCLLAILNGLRQMRLSLIPNDQYGLPCDEDETSIAETSTKQKLVQQMHRHINPGQISVDVLGIVCNLRLQRGGMVQNSEQYELIHRALCLYLQKLNNDQNVKNSKQL